MSETILQTAYADFKAGRLDDAEKAVGSLLQESKDNAKAYHLAAMITRKRGAPKVAHQYLTAGLRLVPDDHEMLNTLGSLFSDMHDPVRAAIGYDAALKQKPDYEAAQNNLAFLHLAHQNPVAALPIFEALLTQNPQEIRYHLGRIYALKEAGHYAQALTKLEGLSDAKTRAEQALTKGQLLFLQGQFQEAVQAYNGAIDSPKFGPQAISNVAQILRMLGQWQAADAYLSGMLIGEGERPEMAIAAAKAYHKAEHSDEALRILSTVKDNADGIAARGAIYLDQGLAKKAHEHLMRALQGRPGDLRLMADFARASLAAGKVEDCMVAAEAALKRYPNDQFWIAMLATGGRMKGQNYHHYYDYDRLVRVYDVSPPKGYVSMSDFNAALIKALEDIHQFSEAPLDQSVRGGVQTSPNLVYDNHPVLQAFFEALQTSLDDYLQAIGQDPGHPLSRRNTAKARISSAWSVRLGRDGYHVNHVHPEGWISSSYYVQVPDEVKGSPDKVGWIAFGQPPHEIARHHPELGAEHFVEPKPGRLVLFPSYMWHGTVPIAGDAPRLTLPFDVLPA